uniref:Uncharacterized protein n=1 Tax=Trieres chinensis TaxID=1514140 RepID=A0A7S2EX27_TRICV|mmetsp:Transcript_7987/g.16935  ORF Transcript_7987/g.16935 Transcript_7987/m.16935 type:complete len:195 (+) Transcript_7987:3-587(+)
MNQSTQVEEEAETNDAVRRRIVDRINYRALAVSNACVVASLACPAAAIVINRVVRNPPLERLLGAPYREFQGAIAFHLIFAGMGHMLASFVAGGNGYFPFSVAWRDMRPHRREVANVARAAGCVCAVLPLGSLTLHWMDFLGSDGDSQPPCGLFLFLIVGNFLTVSVALLVRRSAVFSLNELWEDRGSVKNSEN